MTQLVIDGRKSADHWTHLTDDEALAASDFTVSVARWHERRTDIVNHVESGGCALGIRVAIDVDPMRLADDVDRFALVIIRIQSQSDGRVFSIAARLRERLGFRGEVRVAGDVAPDQLSFMRRCGINAFELGDHVDIENFVHRYRRYYQSSGPLTSGDNLIRYARRRNLEPPRRRLRDVRGNPLETGRIETA